MEVINDSIGDFTFGLAFDNSLRYPIRYAILEIEDLQGWQLDGPLLKPVTTPVAYIVSKCYLVGEKRTYLNYGGMCTSYEVVFPYKNSDLWDLDNQRRIVPEWTLTGDIVNSTSVSQVFASFDEASKEADCLNSTLLSRQIGCMSVEQVIDQKPRAKHESIIKKCKELEQKLEEVTSDMIVFPTSLEGLIAKVIERPKEFYEKLAESLLPEEREYLKRILQDKSCTNCTNGCCRVESSEKVGLDESGKPQGSDCAGWNNSELIGRLVLRMKV